MGATSVAISPELAKKLLEQTPPTLKCPNYVFVPGSGEHDEGMGYPAHDGCMTPKPPKGWDSRIWFSESAHRGRPEVPAVCPICHGKKVVPNPVYDELKKAIQGAR